MEVETRRVRRFGIQRHNNNYDNNSNTLLPLHASISRHVSNTISCWYCDYKITTFNKPLFHFGRKHARFLKVWFTIGVGFALSVLLGVTLFLLWELARALYLCSGSNKLGNLSSDLLFGFNPLLSDSSFSLADAGYICISTIISVSAHELGHAVAVTSEGIPIEYTAIFIAILFPGALVAFNCELLQTLPPFTALRVYSAGIWHNAVVLDVPPTSPLSGYLAPGDIILSVDNVPVRNAQEWLELNTLTYNIKLNNVNISQDTGDFGVFNRMKGYCVPSFMMEESKVIESLENQQACPGEFTAFVQVSCSTNITMDDGWSETDLSNRGRNMYCLNAKDVVKLNKCRDDWGLATTNGSGCTCSQDEFCIAPVQEPGLVWVEITFSIPSSPECSLHERNRFSDSETSGIKETNCGGTFIFVGDVISMAHSIQLTSYQPRWGLKFVAYFPNILEMILIWTFRVSLAMALLNGLPVCYLDGEYILDGTLLHFTSLNPRKRKKVLRLCLLGGLLISIIAFLQELLLRL